MRGSDQAREPVAFTAAETAPIVAETSAWGEEEASSLPSDYPEGLGARSASTNETEATNGRQATATPR